jgi:benzoylformate decarboxylase
MSAAQKSAAKQRGYQLGAEKRKQQDTERRTDRAHWDEQPMPASQFMAELAELAPDDLIIFDEAITTSPDLVRYLVPDRPGAYFQTRGGSLGVGIPGALGLKLAHPDRTVFGFTGDGGAMYTIQALWTAAHHQIDAKIVVCNNRGYRILKANIQQYWRERGLPEHSFPASFDLCGPDLRFDRMAAALGVPAARVEAGSQVRSTIIRALETKGPFLIDLVIDGDVPHDIGHLKCGQ